MFYSNRVLKNSGALDIDVTTGYGTEIFASAALIEGTYLVYANYYGSNADQDMFPATVTTISNENTLDEKTESIVVPHEKTRKANACPFLCLSITIKPKKEHARIRPVPYPR